VYRRSAKGGCIGARTGRDEPEEKFWEGRRNRVAYVDEGPHHTPVRWYGGWSFRAISSLHPHVRSLLEISIALLSPHPSPFARLLLARFKKLLFFLHVRNWAFPAFDSPPCLVCLVQIIFGPSSDDVEPVTRVVRGLERECERPDEEMPLFGELLTGFA
jgi:hypothetical protein